MKKLLLLLSLAPTLLFGQAANTIILSQRNPGGTGNIQRDVPGQSAITSGSLPSFLSSVGLGTEDSPTFNNLTLLGTTLAVPDAFAVSSAGSIALTAGGAAKSITLTPSTTGAINLNTAGGGVRLPSTATAGLQLYNTADQTTNFERLEALWSGNTAFLATAKGGTGIFRTLGLSRETNAQTSGTQVGVSITPTYNQASGTAANTDLLINRTQTAVGSGTQSLIDAQVGGVSQFRVGNAGGVTQTGNLTFGTSGSILNGATGSIGLTATGTNQSITLTPTGTGSVLMDSSTAATNTTSGAGRVGTNIGLSGNAGGPSYFGGQVNIASTGSTAALITSATNNTGNQWSFRNAGSATDIWGFFLNGSNSMVWSSSTTGSAMIFANTGEITSKAGLLSTSPTAGIGYGTGAGGTVTQITGRTTGVTLNKVTGTITLVSAAGSTAWQSFTVTNSAVGAADTIIPNQVSGTDLYMLHITNIAAGSFRITFATTGGTTTEQPVFRFTVIKSVSS